MPLQHKDRTILLHALADSAQFVTVRSRQTLVRNALAGYPESAEVEKALRFLDWEGSPVEVADQLLQLLDGHAPAPGVAALGLIAQALEPVAGAHRDALHQLRVRLRWGTDLEPAREEPWRDARPNGELVQERIIGENTLRPMYYLRRALRAAEAVVRIDLDGAARGTGFLVGDGLVMTNNHVIATAEQAIRAHAVFFSELPDPLAPAADQPPGAVVAFPAIEAFLYTNKDLDFTVLRFAQIPQRVQPLPLRMAVALENQRVAIIQHAGGEPKRISLQNNMVAYGDTRRVQYYTSTLGGSSGSPVFDDGFAVIAIHHSWVPTGNETGAKSPEHVLYRNQGSSMIAVVEDLQVRAPHLLAEMTILEGS